MSQYFASVRTAIGDSLRWVSRTLRKEVEDDNNQDVIIPSRETTETVIEPISVDGGASASLASPAQYVPSLAVLAVFLVTHTSC